MKGAARGAAVKRLSVEFVVVVLGVLVALAVDEFRDARQDTELAAFYLAALEADLVSDSTSLADAAAWSREKSAAADTLVRWLRPGAAPTNDTSAKWALRQLGGIAGALIQDGTYRDLVSSGNSRLIADPALRSSIHSYYSLAEAAGAQDEQSVDRFLEGLPRGLATSSWLDTTTRSFRDRTPTTLSPPEWDLPSIARSLRSDADASILWLRRHAARMAVAAIYLDVQRTRTEGLLEEVRAAR